MLEEVGKLFKKGGNLKVKMTSKQQTFIDEYLIDMNSTQAAIRSGYSVKRAKEIGYQLLHKTTLREAIDKAMDNRAKKNMVTAEYVLTSLQKVANRCMQKEAVLDKQGNKIGEYKFDSSGANKSLELLGKHMRLFVDKVETISETKVNNKIDLSGYSVEQLKELLNQT